MQHLIVTHLKRNFLLGSFERIFWYYAKHFLTKELQIEYWFNSVLKAFLVIIRMVVICFFTEMSRNLQHTKYALSKSIFLKLHLFGKLPKLCPRDSILHVYFLHATATNHLNTTYTYILDKRTFTNCFAKRLVCPRLLLYIHQIL